MIEPIEIGLANGRFVCRFGLFQKLTAVMVHGESLPQVLRDEAQQIRADTNDESVIQSVISMITQNACVAEDSNGIFFESV